MNNYLEKLEYNKILEKLSNYAITYLGKNTSLALFPSNNKNQVQNMLEETEEAVNLLYRCNTPPISEIADNTINIKTIESYGVLSIKSILELANILNISEDLKKYFSADYIDTNEFLCLENIFSKLYSNTSITSEISRCIIDESNIDDRASKELSSIRKKQRNIEQDIKSKLNTFLHSSTYSKYIQENVVTIRNDRYVIPVKEEYRSQIKGFVHDISSSGSTVFIEPISVFELNNEIADLKIDESLEIEKILQNLSKLFYPYVEEIKKDIECIGKLDFIFAKAKYSKNIGGITPLINDNKEIKLINFSKGLTNKDIEFFKKLFKKIVSYGRKIILVDKNSNMFMNCVDNLYVINKEIILETDDLYNEELKKYIDVPSIVEFTHKSLENGIKLNHYNDLDDLLKAIYRIKSWDI